MLSACFHALTEKVVCFQLVFLSYRILKNCYEKGTVVLVRGHKFLNKINHTLKFVHHCWKWQLTISNKY